MAAKAATDKAEADKLAAKAAAEKVAADKATAAKFAAEKAQADKVAAAKAAADKAAADKLAAKAAADKAEADKLAAKAAAEKIAADKAAAAKLATEKVQADKIAATKAAADKAAADKLAVKTPADAIAPSKPATGNTVANVQIANTIVSHKEAIADVARAVNLGSKGIANLATNPTWIMASKDVGSAASGASALMSGITTYQAYKQGDRLGATIAAVKTISSSSEMIGRPIPLVGSVASMATSAQSLGTSLGTNTGSAADKGFAVGASGFELIGKGAAFGAGYLFAGPVGAGNAVKGADVALAGGRWAGDKATDTQLFKSVTDGWLHTKTNENRAAEYQREIDALQAQRGSTVR